MTFPNPVAAEQPGSPRVIETEDYITITRIYQIPHLLTDSERIQQDYIPGSDYRDPEFGAEYVGNRLSPGIVGWDIIEIDFRKRKAPDATYEVHHSSYEAPIEQDLLGNFLMKWKYNLLGKVAKGSTALPAFAATATDFSDLVANTGYLWSTSVSSGEFQYVWQAATKPGVNTFLKQSTVVTKRKVYTERADAIEWSGEVGYLMTPFETFGLATNVEYWLVRDVRIVEDNGAYAVTVEWLFSDFGWDTDIYSEADISDDGY